MPDGWQVGGATARGASHRRTGKPNQDSIRWLPAGGRGPMAVLAVADGHGSSRSSRSDVGSRFAVDVACREAESLLSARSQGAFGESIRSLPAALVRSWRAAVAAHLATEPLDGEGEGDDDPMTAYGSTLLVAVAGPALAILQLGDGDVLVVDGEGRVRRPLPPDDRLVAEETTSLCLPDAARDFRCEVVAAPALALLCTDGYANAFATDDDFLLVGSDVLRLVRERGMSSVQASLPAWLDEASTRGSGDDVTCGVLVR
jgi:serine/threonine protein phosphatase PrpC